MYIEVITQVLEDGRAKGGDEYTLPVSLAEAMKGERFLGEMVADWAEQTLTRSLHTFEYVVVWELCDGEPEE